MKKNLLFVALLFACFFLSAQNTDVIKVANLERYAESNEDLLSLGIKKHAVIFIGNSITEGCAKTRPEFFSSNNYIELSTDETDKRNKLIKLTREGKIYAGEIIEALHKRELFAINHMGVDNVTRMNNDTELFINLFRNGYSTENE